MNNAYKTKALLYKKSNYLRYAISKYLFYFMQFYTTYLIKKQHEVVPQKIIQFDIIYFKSL